MEINLPQLIVEKDKLIVLFLCYFCYYFRLAFKVVITSTAVYWTNQLEVWSALSSKDRAYDRVISCAKKYITKNTPDSLKLQVNINAHTQCIHSSISYETYNRI